MILYKSIKHMEGGDDQGLDSFDVLFEMAQNGKVSRQRMQAPRFVIEQEFISLVQYAASQKDRTTVKMSREEQIYDNFTNQWKRLLYSILYNNSVM